VRFPFNMPGYVRKQFINRFSIEMFPPKFENCLYWTDEDFEIIQSTLSGILLLIRSFVASLNRIDHCYI
jgi:hypothetical protein